MCRGFCDRNQQIQTIYARNWPDSGLDKNAVTSGNAEKSLVCRFIGRNNIFHLCWKLSPLPQRWMKFQKHPSPFHIDPGDGQKVQQQSAYFAAVLSAILNWAIAGV
ncbi:uncharacterized protein LOC129745199 [Uranotaenia lowii]|uniref:uncharacterized protein LOC129745199 n=1 Tax=Uranotaenia lowii TaxID=190385 RepID=UPI002478EF9B|nr:uncharacterized protein LOC129745199 [Uranotaenia lowii]